MSVIRTLSVRVATDLDPLDDGYRAAIARSQDFARRVGSIDVAPKVGGSEGGGLGDSVGNDIRSSIAAGMSPLRGLGQAVATQLELVGGTFVTLAKRIDLAMKDASGFTERQLGRMAAGFRVVNVAGLATAAKLAAVFAAPIFAPVTLGALALAAAFPAIKAVATRTSAAVKAVADAAKSSIVGVRAIATEFRQAGSASEKAMVAARLGLRGLSGGAALATKAVYGVATAMPRIADAANRALSRASGYFTMLGKVTKNTLGVLGAVATKISAIGPASRAAGQGMRALTSELSSVFGVAAGFGAAGVLVGFLSGGIRGATALTESLNKVEVAFGGASASIKGMANGLASSFGAPTGMILDAATGLGLFGRAAGFSEAQAADFAARLTQLAVDAKSFHHVGLDESLGKIRSALAGQSEPLREWGVLITEDAVKAEAMRLGLAKTSDSITEGAKVQARASLITKQLGYVTGDMAATAGSTANMFDALRGRISNLATSVGKYLIPAVDSVLRGLNWAAVAAQAWVDSNGKALTSFGQYLWDVVENVGAGLANLATGFVAFGADVAETLGIASVKARGFGGAVSEALEVVGFAWRHAGSLAMLAWIDIKEWFINARISIETFATNLQSVATYIGTVWREVIVKAVASVGGVFAKLGENLGNLSRSIVAFAKNPFGGVAFNWKPIFDEFKLGAIPDLPKMIQPQYEELAADRKKWRAKMDADEEAWQKRQRAAQAPAVRRPGFMPVVGDQEKAAKDKGPQFAGAMELGSAEAYSTIVKATGGGNDLADIGRKQLAVQNRQVVVQNRQVDILGAIARRLGEKVVEAVGI